MKIEDIAALVAFLVALISGILYLYRMFNKFLKTTFKEEFEKINDKMDELSKRIDATELETCKNFLAVTLMKLERNNAKLDAITEQRFWENYERYKALGGNSYITHKVLELQSKGLL